MKLSDLILQESENFSEVVKVIHNLNSQLVFIVDESSVLKDILPAPAAFNLFLNGFSNRTIAEACQFLKRLNKLEPLPQKLAPKFTFQGIHNTYEITTNELGQVMDFKTVHTVLQQNPGMRCLISAGGLGTRLGHHTQQRPKPMVPLAGKPLLEHIITNLKEHGIDEIYISVRHLKEQIMDHFQDGQAFGCQIRYIEEHSPLGTGGALRFLPASEKDTLVINGDVVTDLNLSSMHKFHIHQNAAISMAVKNHEVKIPFGVAEINDLNVYAIKEKPTLSTVVNAGIYILSNSSFRYMPATPHFNMTDFIESVIESQNKIVSFPILGYWRDVGSIVDYETAQSEFGPNYSSTVVVK